jgi:hypothetical protein
MLRAKTVKRALLKLFLISALPLTLKEAFGASASAEEKSARDKRWFTVTIKKRKLIDRSLSAVNKVKIINRDLS